jgi:hypothetical protein
MTEKPIETIEIIACGGLPGANPFDRASFGETEIHRADGETEGDFRWRARLLARADGANCIVFGGLPS